MAVSQWSYYPHIWKRSLTLNLGLRRTFRWVFVVASVGIPILGADFLCHYSLLVDMMNSRLVDTITQLRVQGILSEVESPRPSFFLYNILHLQPSLPNTQLFFSHTSVAILFNLKLHTIFIPMAHLLQHDHEGWLQRSYK